MSVASEAGDRETFNDWHSREELQEFMNMCYRDWDEQTAWEGWYDTIKDTFSGCSFQEDEDRITKEYKDSIHKFFTEDGSMDETKQQEVVHRRQSSARGRRKSFDSGEQARQMMNLDTYSALTYHLIDARMLEEIGDSAKNRVRIFYSNIFQFLIAVCVFSLGATELDGGQFEAVIASFISGIIAVLGSVAGLLGALGENENLLVKFMVCNFWLMSILTTFLYTEVHMAKNAEDECSPSRQAFSPDTEDGCDDLRGRHSALIALAFIQLLTVFFGAYVATNLLDSVNDRTRLEQKKLFFTYFSIRNYECKSFMRKYVPSDITFQKPVDKADEME